LRISIAVLAALGAGIAAYLTVVKLSGAPIACSTGGCETVAQSHYSAVGGVPVAALGLGAYLLIFVSALLASDVLVLAAAIVSAGGALFAAYLLYVQAAVLHAYCQWCLASDVVLAVLVVLTVRRALRLSREERADRPDGSSPSARPAAARARSPQAAPSPQSPRTG
jgi:uncharacterized membrane protein